MASIPNCFTTHRFFTVCFLKQAHSVLCKLMKSVHKVTASKQPLTYEDTQHQFQKHQFTGRRA